MLKNTLAYNAPRLLAHVGSRHSGCVNLGIIKWTMMYMLDGVCSTTTVYGMQHWSARNQKNLRAIYSNLMTSYAKVTEFMLWDWFAARTCKKVALELVTPSSIPTLLNEPSSRNFALHLLVLHLRGKKLRFMRLQKSSAPQEMLCGFLFLASVQHFLHSTIMFADISTFFTEFYSLFGWFGDFSVCRPSTNAFSTNTWSSHALFGKPSKISI